MEICQVLDAKLCVVQLPPSFTCCDEYVKNLSDFFGSAERPVPIGVELRHRSWDENRSIVESMLKKFGALHIVDPLVKAPVAYSDIGYYRLHGLGERLYRYNYTDGDLSRLRDAVLCSVSREVYVMFNNISMREDCSCFKHMLE